MNHFIQRRAVNDALCRLMHLTMCIVWNMLDKNVDDVSELIKGLEQLVMEEHYEVEIEMNFKWKTNQQRLADQSASKDVATIN